MIFSQSNLLNKFANLKYAFTTQKSGNLAYHVNDNPLHVDNSHEKLAKDLKYDRRTLVHMKQIHSDIVHLINDKDNFKNPPTCDALITNKPNTPLMVMVADCSPILFYDNQNRVIAVAHAGRQGAFKNIIKNTIYIFKNNFNTDSTHLHVAIGASIGVCCYEVGSEINDEAISLNLGFAIEKRDNRYYLNISKILKKQLQELGIKDENIEINNECTCCNSNKYYSYRADQKAGRNAGIIYLG